MSGTEPVWVGVDVGTQGVRAVAVGQAGEVRGTGRAALYSSREDGRHEQDPRSWWDAVCVSTRAATVDLRSARVLGVAVDATSGTVLATDRSGEPLTPGLMYDDLRARDRVGEINEAGRPVWEAVGYRRMQPSWALPKLAWLSRSTAVPGRRLLHQTDYVNWRLVGEQPPTDLNTALKSGADLRTGEWPTDVLGAVGVDAEELPSLVRPGTPIGTVCREAAAETGLPEGTPVLAGTTDGCAAQLASGAVTEGSWSSVLGTTLVLKGVTHEPTSDPHGVVYSHRSPDGRWLPGGASSAGAGILSTWFSTEELHELPAPGTAPEAIVYPLAGRGERFPFVAPDAECFAIGTPRAGVELYHATLFGIAYLERLCFDHLRLLGLPTDGPVVVTGGATRNRALTQLRADVLGTPLALPRNSEPALGAAVLAASASSDVATRSAAMTAVDETIEPRPAPHYDDGYLRLVEELHRRGWVPDDLALRARGRTTP
jgi:sugar (pentulose or hexulose) kinase